MTSSGAPDAPGVGLGVLDDELIEDHPYWIVCRNADDIVVYADVFYHQPGINAVSPTVLANRARNELPIQYATPHTSPSIVFDQLVGIDTWLWLDPAFWATRTATAAIPGLSVTATATPQTATWTMGDGTTTVCDGPGTPYDNDTPERLQHTNCSHLYQSRGNHDATVTIQWDVHWTATNGATGTLPDIQRTTGFPMTVIDREAIGRS